MRRTLLTLLASLSLVACAPIGDEEESDFVEDLENLPADEGKADGPKLVGDYLQRGCTTAAVLPLAQQIVEQMICIAPDQVSRLQPSSRIKLVGAAVLPYMDPAAREDLEAAARELGSVEIESGMRTLPQQVLLHAWQNAGRCNIAAAARPGRSNHESARAVDLRNPRAIRRVLARHGWTNNVPDDPVHFDHPDSPDGRGLDVVAFQRLWNLNHPDDRIDESGDYDSETARRIRLSPAKGFSKSTCDRAATPSTPTDPGTPTDPNTPTDPTTPADPNAPHPSLDGRFDPRRATDWVRIN